MEAPKRREVIEGIPAAIRSRMAAGTALRRKAVGGMVVQYIFTPGKKWTVGQTLRVAFNGGDLLLRRDIASAAAAWTQYANLGLDFGYNPASGNFREWHPTDTVPAAEIRIGFDKTGYWSCVGTDSLDQYCAAPGTQSMNFSGFDRDRPKDWRSVVIHEFGHALGFQHEHQNPNGGCNNEFRWNDDPGYQLTLDGMEQAVEDSSHRMPGIYTVLERGPNYWDIPTIDGNLKDLPNSYAYVQGDFDKTSIMMYSFPAWMFVHGGGSPCYTKENPDLSPQDIQGASKFYNRNLAVAAQTLLEQQSQMQRQRAASMPDDLKSLVDNQLSVIKSLRLPPPR
jgi:hypothetical protein